MRKFILGLSVIGSMLLLQGCAAVLVGGLIYLDAEEKKNKALFYENFEQRSLERQKLGLSPLVWCDELKRRDEKWWRADALCNPETEEQKLKRLSDNYPN